MSSTFTDRLIDLRHSEYDI